MFMKNMTSSASTCSPFDQRYGVRATTADVRSREYEGGAASERDLFRSGLLPTPKKYRGRYMRAWNHVVLLMPEAVAGTNGKMKLGGVNAPSAKVAVPPDSDVAAAFEPDGDDEQLAPRRPTRANTTMTGTFP